MWGKGMRRVSKKIAWLTVCGFIFLTGYAAVSVLQARRATPEIFAKILAEGSGTIRLSEVPIRRVEQLLAVEDPGFYQHHGVDLSTPGAGLTTITQAMVKYLYFDAFHPGFMKVEQTLIAWLAVDPLVSKDDQLEAFINTAYLGHVGGAAIRGFSHAAKVYFGKRFNELSDEEYLALVAMLIAQTVLVSGTMGIRTESVWN